MSWWGFVLIFFSAMAGSYNGYRISHKMGSRKKMPSHRAISYPPAVADQINIDLAWLSKEMGPLLRQDEIVALEMARIVCIRIADSPRKMP